MDKRSIAERFLVRKSQVGDLDVIAAVNDLHSTLLSMMSASAEHSRILGALLSYAETLPYPDVDVTTWGPEDIEDALVKSNGIYDLLKHLAVVNNHVAEYMHAVENSISEDAR